MRPPTTTRGPTAQTRRADEGSDRDATGSSDENAEDSSHSGTFEPLLAGDRQKQKRVAKARNALQMGAFEVSLS
jgi:hypothetical protein